MSQNKKAYMLGGEKAHQEATTKRPYKAEPALVMQPRFKEPFYHNYDTYEVDGVNGKAEHGPGEGWHAMQNYKSVAEFLKDRRKKSKTKYHADDSWKQDDGSITKNPKASKARMEFLSIIKNGIDFPIDDQIKSSPILPDEGIVGNSNLTGGVSDEYLPEPDLEGKLPTELNYGRDYDENSIDNINDLLDKYLDLGDNYPLYGLPDGLKEQEGFEDQIDPSSGKTESGTVIYDKM